MTLITRQSLLARLGAAHSDADWEVFYAQYEGVILSFAHKRGLDADSARDVLQETMLVLLRELPAFQYDPGRGRFRNWLLTIVLHKIRAARRRARAELHLSLDGESQESQALQESLAAPGQKPESEIEAAWRQSLLEEALRRLLEDPKTQSLSVEVFRAYALDGGEPAEVAARFGMKENAVYQIKARLLARLQGLLVELESGVPA